MRRFSLWRSVVAVSTLLLFVISQETWALAGTTGGIAGTIRDSSGAPVAGVRVEAISPSQSSLATTDAGGHFAFLSLQPDTYVLNLTKPGFQTASIPGATVFADQTQQYSLTLSKALKTIGHVAASAGNAGLVKAGVGGDLYSVNSAQAAIAAPLGGGGNLNNAYSAMATVPGVQTSVGGMGWDFNAAYVRGQNSSYTGFEYDGIPINRAFDNYNASTESSLGLSELQVYTGGGPASVASAGTAGFINQVIKTGSYPGYAQATLGIGTPTFYHQAEVEVGGATPDRNFSYYAGFTGSNQDFRAFNNQNGANFMVPNGIFSGPAAIGVGIGYTGCTTFTCQGVKQTCPLGMQLPNAGFPPQGCFTYYNGISASPSHISDREDVINVHLGIPKRNGLRDDVQLLWSASALNNYFYQSPNDIGTSPDQFALSLRNLHYAPPTCNQSLTVAPGLTVPGCVHAPNSYYPAYADGVAYNLPFGSPISSAPGAVLAPSPYYAPDTPAHQFDGPIPLYDQSNAVNSNDTGVTKLQYTYAVSSAAYLRVYGYTFYSDWLQTSPLFGSTDELTPSSPAAQYDLITHTAGGAVQFSDQVNDQNLVNVDYNYSTASVVRFNNSSALAGEENSPIGYMGNGKCYDAHSGKAVPCLSSSYYNVALGTTVSPGTVYGGKTGPCDSTSNPNIPCGWTSVATAGPTGYGGPAGADWDTLWNGNVTGSYNTVRPRFSSASVSDQWRPNDKLMINAAIRYDNFTYVLPDSGDAATAFYASQTANYTCVQASTNQVLTQPLPPGAPPPANAQYVVGDCNAAASTLFPKGPHTGWVHPNGTVQDGVAAPNFTATSTGSYSLDYWQPRISGTYTVSPDTVVRASAGRYTQPPLSSAVQYLGISGDDRSVWNNAMNLGFYSPFHPLPGVSSNQYDMSLEHHFKNTDVSIKLSPFFTWVNQWQQQTFIGANFVTQVPVGVNRDYGVEFQLTKGDFTRNGFSGLFAFTYTNSKVQFQNEGLSTGGVVPNTTTALNQIIAQYNSLTKSGGGAPCYQNATPVSCSTPNGKVAKGFDTVANPYYNQPAQGELDPNGWYNPYTTAIAPNISGAITSYISPIVSSLILNYRHDKLAITPSFQFQTGGFYGSPLDFNGYDPRTCVMNSADAKAPTGSITAASPHTNPLQCNVLTLDAPGLGQFGYFYIPDPQTGHFSALGSYQNPSLIQGNLQVSYDVSPRVKLIATGTNIFHACFGGQSEPWTAANPPNPNFCGYEPAGGVLNSSVYPSNFYNGTSIYDKAANKIAPAWPQSYNPISINNGSIGGAAAPFNVYLNAQIKL